MRFRARLAGLIIIIVVCGLAGCGEKKQKGAAPLIEETSAPFLAAEASDALTHLQDAQRQLANHPANAAETLTKVHTSLSRLLGYYLPLLEARERAQNAYGLFNLGERERAARELDRIEEKLLAMAKSQEETVAREIQEPLEMLEEARVAMTGERAEVPPTLEALARRLNLLLEKGRLVLP